MVASKSSQLEVGLSYRDNFFDSSIFGYYKSNKDGFSNINNFKTYSTSQYDYVLGTDGIPQYVPNGKTRNWITSYFSSGNSLSSKTLGLNGF